MAEPRRRLARDPLGLRRAMADRLLIGLVAAMALLAALALAGRSGADRLAERWREGAQAAVTVQVPQPTSERMERALAVLRDLPEVAHAEAVDPARMAELLRPWLGGAEGLPLPGVIELRLADLSADAALIGARVAMEVPGAVTEAHGVWVGHLAALARAIQGLAVTVLALVAAVAAAVVGVAVRAGLSARRDAVLVLHGLGATDADVAGRFAKRAAWLAGMGAGLGTVLALPALAGLAALAGPLAGEGSWQGLPWLDLLLLPAMAAGVAWVATQATVRRWLRRLP
ncbi:cell division protein FtsX [Roseomonas terrae]|jgi:cell division transport system permease protein|uniref:Cell division protein FtsX n=1 Tax=Neoroseomonas terrae TaxID=424799 RepID=A0ABS5EE07_9PROT|nr:FtsX-like permease family protein [Neoroseomonas terrae]MBR0649251.1 cell division protein FtsX [Neoroseomonas terrae]